jgi:dipeptidase
MLAPPSVTRDAVMLFGKNSDRQRNEAQVVQMLPAANHAAGSKVTCTYISVPQAAHTHAVLLSKPFWIWGAEMGANEHGVVIGNEGLRSRIPAPEEPALIGMDLLRLALERGATAAEAATVITTLLERHGQGGNCGHLIPSYYHNSFMVADPSEAFVVETVGRDWLVERVHGVRAISNDYSIFGAPERTSEGLPSLVRKLGWQEAAPPSYAEVLANPQTAHIGSAGSRRARATTLMRERAPGLEIEHVMQALRDHDPNGECAGWDPKRATRFSLCIHAGADEKASQTTGAMASEIRARDSVHWLTGTSAPCMSIFKPVLFGTPLPDHGPPPTDRFDPRTLWWRHERMHRAALFGNYDRVLSEIAPERDTLEADFRSRVKEVLNGGTADERAQVVAHCWKMAHETEATWASRIEPMPLDTFAPYVSQWNRMNALAGMPPP